MKRYCKGAIYYQQILQVGRSGAERVYLSGVNWATEGAFRCEVTADDFETVADSRQSNVVGERDIATSIGFFNKLLTG